MPEIHSLLAAESARASCLIARDTTALRKLLHEDLIYVHSTGVRHERNQLVAFVESGPRFLTVALDAPICRVYGPVGLVSGTLRMTLLRIGSLEPVDVRSHVTAAWLREVATSETAWRLLRFHSTRPAD